mgnify:CR=1 FL=1
MNYTPLYIKTDNSIRKNEIKEIELETFDVFHEIDIAHAKYGLDNTFISFLYYNIPYIVFATKDKSIVSFDLIRNVKINSIKGGTFNKFF